MVATLPVLFPRGLCRAQGSCLILQKSSVEIFEGQTY